MITVNIDPDLDDGVVREFLEKERLHIFQQIIDDINLDTYPYKHQVGNVFDGIELFKAVNRMVEYYGGDGADWDAMYSINESLKKHPVHDD